MRIERAEYTGQELNLHVPRESGLRPGGPANAQLA
jgi:hypothetical protein